MTAGKAIQLEQISYKELLESFESIVSEKVKEALNNQATVNAPSEFMTRQDVATLFDVSLPTIHAWINVGILTPYKIGAKTRFKRNEVLASPKAIKHNLGTLKS